jgi:putative SOS response-associated peptidase YedK
MSAFHHRMPVILERNEEDLWLASDVEASDMVMPLLDQYPAARIEAFPVSTRVNSVRNNDPDLMDPIDVAPDEEQGSLF